MILLSGLESDLSYQQFFRHVFYEFASETRASIVSGLGLHH